MEITANQYLPNRPQTNMNYILIFNVFGRRVTVLNATHKNNYIFFNSIFYLIASKMTTSPDGKHE